MIMYCSGCQTQEKVVAASAHTFVVIADDSKQSAYLGEKVKICNALYGIGCMWYCSPTKRNGL